MPLLRLLLLLGREARDMDECELDLLSLSWAYITIYLIGVNGCPRHHRHSNELQRISDVNPHVFSVDAQGDAPERFTAHEIPKRHLGQELSLSAFEKLKQPPEYFRGRWSCMTFVVTLYQEPTCTRSCLGKFIC
jgi:hypothetical protein